jgi:hypothetical protein
LQSKISRNRRIGGERYRARCKYLYPVRCKYIHLVATLAEQEFQKQELEERDIQLDVSTCIQLDVSIITWYLHLQSKRSRNRRIGGEKYPARCNYIHMVPTLPETGE